MSDITDVRTLIPDTDSALFSDDEIQTYLTLYADDVFSAAAVALEVLASKMTLEGYGAVVKTDDLSIQDNIAALLTRASQLRAMSVNDTFVIVDPEW